MPCRIHSFLNPSVSIKSIPRQYLISSEGACFNGWEMLTIMVKYTSIVSPLGNSILFNCLTLGGRKVTISPSLSFNPQVFTMMESNISVKWRRKKTLAKSQTLRKWGFLGQVLIRVEAFNMAQNKNSSTTGLASRSSSLYVYGHVELFWGKNRTFYKTTFHLLTLS